MLSIRAATPEDIPLLLAFIRKLAEYERAPEQAVARPEDLLRDGPYPLHLKQRIRSNHGHLSNRASAELLDGLLWDGLDAVFLAHLSETNNDSVLAESCSRAVLDGQNRCRPLLIVGTQAQASTCFVA